MPLSRFHAAASCFIALILCVSSARAAEQTWTLDPFRTRLTINATTNATLQWTPQVPGSDVAQFTGTMTADRVFNAGTGKTTLTFNGGDTIDAQLHASAPFPPGGVNTTGIEDNYGYLLPVGGATAQGNVRDLKFDITGGTVTVGEPGNASVDPTSGVLNYAVQGDATFQFLHVLNPVASTSASPITLVEHGGGETLRMPIDVTYLFSLTAVSALVEAQVVGTLVGTRGNFGDYSGNGTIGLEDYQFWVSAYGTNNPAADGNGDGTVNAADYTIWRNRVAGLPGGGSLAGGSHGVPEPISLVLVAFTGSMLLASRGFALKRSGGRFWQSIR